jgi:hypothetical protein
MGKGRPGSLAFLAPVASCFLSLKALQSPIMFDPHSPPRPAATSGRTADLVQFRVAASEGVISEVILFISITSRTASGPLAVSALRRG